LFNTAKLVRIKEVVGCHMELEPCTDDLLYEFSCCVKQDNGAEGFWCVVGGFVGLGNNNRRSSFELGRPSFKFGARIHYKNDLF